MSELNPIGAGTRIMKLISLNVARPRLTMYKGAAISTGIFKKPVSGRVALRTLNLDGDQQADLSVHGGPYKAVYAYPFRALRILAKGTAWEWTCHGARSAKILQPWVLKRTNFTLATGLKSVRPLLMVRQPRMPCYKLAAKFQRDDMIERFLVSGR